MRPAPGGVHVGGAFVEQAPGAGEAGGDVVQDDSEPAMEFVHRPHSSGVVSITGSIP